MRIRLKTAALLAVLAAVAGFVAVDASRDDEPIAAAAQQSVRPPQEGASAAAPAPQGAPAEQQAFVVPERSGLAGSAGTPLFESQTWQPPPPPPQKAAKPAPPPPPQAPPLPYTFVGRLIHDGKLSLLIAKGDNVIPIREGDMVDGIYRVESISDTQITMLYLPLKQKQTIPVLTALAEAQPTPAAAAGATSPFPSVAGGGSARGLPTPVPAANVLMPQGPVGPGTATLAWTGPPQVKLGTPFDVKLRVNANQPLHAWPMQLRVDPAYFEVVTVKPGRLPGGSDPNFTYRLNADGSIFVGASVQQPAAGPDAEIVALTLKPVKTAPAAEVSVASLNLQGAAGRPIPYAQVAAFKTVITP